MIGLWNKYYEEAILSIEQDKVPAYYLDSKIRDLSEHLSYSDKNFILLKILSSNCPSNIFRYLNKNKALIHICWHLDSLRFVPQNKGKSKNAFDHTLRVMDAVPKERITLRWVALLHDLGKHDSYYIDKNFNKHQIYSYNIAKIFTKLYDIEEDKKIVNIVRNHMFPLDYQRQPNWTDKGVKRLIERIGKEDVLDTISFAYYDKKAENDVKEYLDIIDDLFYRVTQELLIDDLFFGEIKCRE